MAVETEQERVRHYRQRAAEVRTMAANGSNLKIRRQLLELAKQWEQLVNQAHGLAKGQSPKRPSKKRDGQR